MTKIIWGARRIITVLSLVVFVSIILNIVLIYINAKGNNSNTNSKGVSESKLKTIEGINSIRLNSFNFCKPLLLVNIPSEAEKLNPLKEKAMEFIKKEIALKNITTASVYLKTLKDGSWMEINQDEQYYPASMYKIAVLIAFLKTAESNTSLLSEKIKFTIPQTSQRDNRNTGNFLEVGKFYTYKDLLYRMIVYSDNESANLLMLKTGREELKKLSDYLQIPGEAGALGFQINVVNMSKYLRILYNGTYLSPENSEYALTLLSESKYEDGIARNMDKSIQLVHKFGERNMDTDPQLHETAIIYLKDNPILLTIMTKGNDYKKLSREIAELSKLILVEAMQMN